MQEWEKRQRHEVEVRRVLREDGCMDVKGQLRAWHGKGNRTHAVLEQAGHDSLDFFKCKCKEC